MEDRYQQKIECLWYADCCPENRCDGKGKVRAKARIEGGEKVIIPSICRSYWPTEKDYQATQEQKLEKTARTG